MRNALTKFKFINWKRQASNLGSILCKSTFTSSNSNLEGKVLSVAST